MTSFSRARRYLLNKSYGNRRQDAVFRREKERVSRARRRLEDAAIRHALCEFGDPSYGDDFCPDVIIPKCRPDAWAVI